MTPPAPAVAADSRDACACYLRACCALRVHGRCCADDTRPRCRAERPGPAFPRLLARPRQDRPAIPHPRDPAAGNCASQG
ncbi:hypothetical protein ACCUM_0437 [Candidatus Accumulibacter phosphatis]|uniref:Uncharacterized protein n=1 Tax=Candidatus Accumulibacter phosphatis TaxID=327160 RepID=A0A5S4EGW3_9PROT|nr:hypothetical protein ACCUM_0437 [Candidatus Accumulibacter phosphatis]